VGRALAVALETNPRFWLERNHHNLFVPHSQWLYNGILEELSQSLALFTGAEWLLRNLADAKGGMLSES
jgi:hypothetical protein